MPYQAPAADPPSTPPIRSSLAAWAKPGPWRVSFAGESLREDLERLAQAQHRARAQLHGEAASVSSTSPAPAAVVREALLTLADHARAWVEGRALAWAHRSAAGTFDGPDLLRAGFPDSSDDGERPAIVIKLTPTTSDRRALAQLEVVLATINRRSVSLSEIIRVAVERAAEVEGAAALGYIARRL